MKVAIVGAGRLGTALVKRLVPGTSLAVIDSDLDRARELAALAEGAVAADQLVGCRGARAVLLALPPGEIAPVVAEMEKWLSKETLVVDLATESPTDQIRQSCPGVRLASAKVLGQAREISRGADAVILVDAPSEEDVQLLVHLLKGIGTVARGPADLVRRVNMAVAEEVIRCERSLRKRMAEFSLDPEWVRVAIGTTAVGILRSLATGDAGPFLKEVGRRMDETPSGD